MTTPTIDTPAPARLTNPLDSGQRSGSPVLVDVRSRTDHASIAYDVSDVNDESVVNDEAAVARRRISGSDRVRFQRNIAEILTALGLDLDTPGTRDTPRRFLAALEDATEGYEGDPKLVTAFPTECHGGANCELAQIVEGPIPFFALCEHHALPFFGRAWLGYVAHEEILGISKLTRLVRVLTRQFGVQERMTHQLADSLAALVHAHGVAVYLEAEHLCTQMRGVREHESMTRTTAYRGVYESDPTLRAEFRDIAGIGRERR